LRELEEAERLGVDITEPGALEAKELAADSKVLDGSDTKGSEKE
jgi:hypothetical protein